MTRDLFDTMNDGDDTSHADEVEKVTLTLIVHTEESNRVVFVSETEDSKRIMLPLKEINIEPTGRRTSTIGKPKLAICNIVMPEWLAKDRGLI